MVFTQSLTASVYNQSINQSKYWSMIGPHCTAQHICLVHSSPDCSLSSEVRLCLSKLWRPQHSQGRINTSCLVLGNGLYAKLHPRDYFPSACCYMTLLHMSRFSTLSSSVLFCWYEPLKVSTVTPSCCPFLYLTLGDTHAQLDEPFLSHHLIPKMWSCEHRRLKWKEWCMMCKAETLLLQPR